MAYRVFGAKPFSKRIMSIGPLGTHLGEIYQSTAIFDYEKCIFDIFASNSNLSKTRSINSPLEDRLLVKAFW